MSEKPAVNLAVSVISGWSYYPQKVEYNGLLGPYGRINIKAGSEVSLAFHFLSASTYEPVNVDRFFFTIAGIDKQPKGAQLHVTVSGHDKHFLSTPSAIEAQEHENGSYTTFSSVESGNSETSLVHALSMSGALRNHSVTLRMPSLSTFTMTVRADQSYGGRNVLFTGSSNLVCDAKPGCSTMTCLEGFQLRKSAPQKVCRGTMCLLERDHNECCIRNFQLQLAPRLELARASHPKFHP